MAFACLYSKGWVDLAVRTPPRLPGTVADLTLTHALEIRWAEIERTIAESALPELVA